MPKVNRKPGIHLHATIKINKISSEYVKEWYWILVAKNSKTIARSSETYKRKGSAVKSIVIASDIMRFGSPGSYFDHSGNEVNQLLINHKSK